MYFFFNLIFWFLTLLIIYLLFFFFLDSDTDTDGSKLQIVTEEDVAERVRFQNSLQEKVSTFVSSLKGRIGSMVSVKSSSGAALLLDIDGDADLQDNMRFPIPKCMYLSPLCAPDSILKQLPPIKLMVSQKELLLALFVAT